jgi:hypothetical protein
MVEQEIQPSAHEMIFTRIFLHSPPGRTKLLI